MKYKVGDKVRIKNDLIVDVKYDGYYFNDCMKEYKGLIVKIIGFAYDDAYKIDADNNLWNWTDAMLEPANKLPDKDKISDKVIFSDKATILFKDGKKYVAKCDEEDTFDKEKGLLLCLVKSIGYGYNDIQKLVENAKDYNKKEVNK